MWFRTNKLGLLKRVIRFGAARCHYCGDRAETKDHLTPTARGGTNDDSNLVSACRACNGLKSSMTFDEFLVFCRDSIVDTPIRLEKYRGRMRRILQRLAPTMLTDHNS